MSIKLPELLTLRESNTDIFKQNDPHEFLEEYVSKSRAISRKYSYRCFSQRVAPDKPLTYFRKVVKGEIQISDQFLYDFSSEIRMSPEEEAFFELLVKKERLEENSKQYLKILNKIRDTQISKGIIHELDHKAMEDMGSWFHLVIREFGLLKNAQIDLPTIKKMLLPYVLRGESDASKVILKFIEDLVRHGLLVEEEGVLMGYLTHSGQNHHRLNL